MLDDLEQVGFQAQEDRLGFRVAHAAVEFERPRAAFLVDHEARVQEAGVRNAVLCHAGHRRQDDLAHDARMDLGGHHRRRRIGAHAAGIRPLVAVAEALVVLAGRQRQHVRAVAHHDEAGFLAFEAVLDHDARARIAQALVAEHHGDRSLGLLDARRDHHAFAGREAVGLDHDRRAVRIDVALGLRAVGKRLVARGGNLVPRHELLGEILGGLELRRRPGGAENLQPARAELVDDARRQRRLGTHDRQVDVLLYGEVGDRAEVGERDVLKPRLDGGAGIAGGDEDFLHPRALRELPGQRMLAASAANDEELHL